MNRKHHGERRSKNTVLGKCYITRDLSEIEYEYFQTSKCDIKEVEFYPSACLTNGRIISAASKSKSTKRNNSCIQFQDESGTCHIEICESIFGLKDTSSHLCFVRKLNAATEQICKDTITHAKLDNHLIPCSSPSRY